MEGAYFAASLNLAKTQDRITSLFSYVVGARSEFFGATEDTIYDITNVISPRNSVLGTEGDDIIGTEDDDMIGWLSTAGMDQMSGLHGGNWVVAQFATAGGTFLIGVNGEDPAFVYDGVAFYPSIAGGTWALAYSASSQDFVRGEIVTGGTSGATATVWDIVPSLTPGEGALLLTGITGDFEAGEALSGNLGGGATSTSEETLVAPGISFPAGVSLTTADLSYVWIFKNRLWFLQKESLSAWYLPIDQIAGELVEFPMGGVLGLGGQASEQSWEHR